MKRTISAMLGKGSVSHNSRMFMANNIDSERSQLNISYCNTPIKDVYRELFDDAVKRFNEKQMRNDRCIDDYYEKIRTGKQEKLFYEVILQVGNKDNMAAISEDGQLACKVLDEYMKDFQKRNPNLKVFSAHLHMDEATPHLHIDFVPFITESKRGLDTRVSLKQALATQGFPGGTRVDTEWNQWVKSEKEQLSQVMERHGIEWEQLDTHHEHLSVIDYKKEQRTKEVAALDSQIVVKSMEVEAIVEKKASVKSELDDFIADAEKTRDNLNSIKDIEQFVAKNASHYDIDPKYELPEPKPMMYAKTYRDKFALPLVKKLKDVIRSILVRYFERTNEMKSVIERTRTQVWSLTERINKLEPENERLCEVERDYSRIQRVLGSERVKELVSTAIAQENTTKELELAAKKKRSRGYER